MNEDINVTFIIPTDCDSENECSEEMHLAFTACEQHSGGGIKAQWVHQSQWKKFDGLTKRDVFVLPEFEGDLFKKLKATKCLLVGPRCLSCCLMEGTPIPSGIEPIFTIAMKNLVVTASGLSKQQKEHIKQRVQWMGGIYSTVLSEDTTHLISDTVLSDKYVKSVEKGIPIMKDSWVDAVWEASLHLNVSGSCSDFDGYKLPPFTNLQVTTSGILKKEKQNIMKLVNENGGVFSGAFQSETTDIVVLTKDGIGSEKYKAALEYNKAIVLPSWITDSVAKGVALPAFKYRVAGASTSSPLAEHRLPDISLNFSRITNLRPPSNFVDESRSVDISTMSARMKLSQDTKRSSDSSLDKDTLAEFEKFDMSLIKKAGPIFDGFCIWITNLDGTPRDRISACISRCGGIRFDTPHARVTHVVAGSITPGGKEVKQLSSVPVLSPAWVLRSVVAGRVLDEGDFLINTNPATPKKSQSRIEPASPMSKRNLQLLRHQTPTKLNLPPPVIEVVDLNDDVVNQYLSQNLPEPEHTPDPPPVQEVQPDMTEDTMEDATEEIEQIFRGIKIAVEGLDTEAICEVGAELAAAGGVLVASGAPSDYTLVPLDWEEGERCVTVFWIKDCLSQQEILPIQYYHRPVKLNFEGTPPLLGVVASLSTYSGVERAFLDELAKLLGAVTQLRFCRRNTATALASTHLICPTPTGDKYSGALKWALPAVTAHWLLKCAAEGVRVEELDYLVGDTRVPSLPVKNEITEEKKTDQKTNMVEKDKENEMLPPVANFVRRGSFNKEQTPKGKVGISDNDPDNMSPASRYIAMARQGLLGSDSQETPKRLQELKDVDRQGETTVRTPSLEDALSTPNLLGLSPTTRRRLQAVRRGEMPSDPIRTPVNPFDKNPDTPDSAFGAALRPGSGRLSPDGRKRLWKIVNDLPSKEVQPARDRITPLSEIRNRFLAQFNEDAPTPPSEHHAVPRKLQLQDQAETPPPKMAKLSEDQSGGGLTITEDTSNITPKASSSTSTPSRTLPAAVDQQLQRLNAALSNRLSSQKKRTRDSVATLPVPEVEAGPDSQINTVGWDDTAPPVKTFMLSSNVDVCILCLDFLKAKKHLPSPSTEAPTETPKQSGSERLQEKLYPEPSTSKTNTPTPKHNISRTLARAILGVVAPREKETPKCSASKAARQTSTEEREDIPGVEETPKCSASKAARQTSTQEREVKAFFDTRNQREQKGHREGVLEHSRGNITLPDLKMARSPKEHAINAFIEFLATLKATREVNTNVCKKILQTFQRGNFKLLEMELDEAKAAIYDKVSSRVIHGSMTGQYMAAYSNTKGFIGLVESARVDDPPKFLTSESEVVVVAECTRVMLDDRILGMANAISSDPEPGAAFVNWELPKLSWVNGVPGCGKTTHIIKHFDEDTEVVASTTVETAKDLREKLAHRLGTKATKRVRTMASILVNGFREGIVINRLTVDEALMNHFGAIVMAARLSGANEVTLIGDINQLPYIDRQNLFELRYCRPSLTTNITYELLCTHRSRQWTSPMPSPEYITAFTPQAPLSTP